MSGLTRLEQIGLEIIERLGLVIHNTGGAAEKYGEPCEFKMDKDVEQGEHRCPKCDRLMASIEDGETKRVSWYCLQVGCRNDEPAPASETPEPDGTECALADECPHRVDELGCSLTKAFCMVDDAMPWENCSVPALAAGRDEWKAAHAATCALCDHLNAKLKRAEDQNTDHESYIGAAEADFEKLEAKLAAATEKLVALDGERNELETRVNHMEDLSERECAMLDDARAALRNAEAERDAARQKPEPEAGSQPWAYLMPDGAGVTGPGTCPLCAYYNGSSCEHPDGVVACQGVDAGSPQFKNQKPEPDAGDYAGVTGATGPHREEPPAAGTRRVTVEKLLRVLKGDAPPTAEPTKVTVEKLLRVLDYKAKHGFYLPARGAEALGLAWPQDANASAEAAKAIRALQAMLKQAHAARREEEMDARDKGAAAERDDLQVRIANCRAQLAASQAKGQRRRKELRRLNRELNTERYFSRWCLRRFRQSKLALRREREGCICDAPPESAVECWTCDYRRNVSAEYPQGCNLFLTWEGCPQGKDRQEPEDVEVDRRCGTCLHWTGPLGTDEHAKYCHEKRCSRLPHHGAECSGWEPVPAPTPSAPETQEPAAGE